MIQAYPERFDDFYDKKKQLRILWPKIVDFYSYATQELRKCMQRARSRQGSPLASRVYFLLIMCLLLTGKPRISCELGSRAARSRQCTKAPAICPTLSAVVAHPPSSFFLGQPAACAVSLRLCSSRALLHSSDAVQGGFLARRAM